MVSLFASSSTHKTVKELLHRVWAVQNPRSRKSLTSWTHGCTESPQQKVSHLMDTRHGSRLQLYMPNLLEFLSRTKLSPLQSFRAFSDPTRLYWHCNGSPSVASASVAVSRQLRTPRRAYLETFCHIPEAVFCVTTSL